MASVLYYANKGFQKFFRDGLDDPWKNMNKRITQDETEAWMVVNCPGEGNTSTEL